MALYQVWSMSIRPAVPMMCAVFGPAAREDEMVVEIAPDAWVRIVAISVSAPVSLFRAAARIVSGRPKMSHANETG